jgi:hypothetical protein
MINFGNNFKGGKQMFVHLGKDVVIPKKDVIMILDYKTNTKVLKNGDSSINYLTDNGKEKSCIITLKEIYISPISSGTLKKRAEGFFG